MFPLFSTSAKSTDHAARLWRIERKLDLILQNLGIDPGEAAEGDLPKEVVRLADAGEKIPAIKLYRAKTGAGLAEAKEAIEDYLRRR